MFERFPILFRSAIYALRGGFLVRPLLIAVTLGAAGAALSSLEESRPGVNTALTTAMRAAYAAQRAEIGPLGYDDRIVRRKAMATPRVHALTAEAEHLLTLRETHRLNGIPPVTFEPAP